MVCSAVYEKKRGSLSELACQDAVRLIITNEVKKQFNIKTLAFDE